MARIDKVVIEITGGDELTASARSVADALSALGGASERIAEFFPGHSELGADCLDLILRKPLNSAAPGATKFEAFKLDPSDRYLEFVAAVARDCHADTFFRHGWPILSVVARTPTVAEAGVAASVPGGGLTA